MKHCENLDKNFDINEDKRPVCGENMQDVPAGDMLSTEEMVSSMTVAGILYISISGSETYA